MIVRTFITFMRIVLALITSGSKGDLLFTRSNNIL